ncbi:MAG: hypothetical protein LBL18_02270 [Bacteroidales bacterium]|jgi:hypothetical protein|nr:hypothetical protein [Bacteroidales bacterium]
MKKNILGAAVIAFALSLFASSCGDSKEKTVVEYLTDAKNGWVLESATSSPAYVMKDGTNVTDLITGGYLKECELDDIIKFTKNGGLTVSPGKLICNKETEYASTWTYNEETKVLRFQIPFFYDNELENAVVTKCTEKQFRVNYTYNDVENPAKKVYTFTLTYKRK